MILFLVLSLVVFLFINYTKKNKKNNEIYPEYFIGEKVVLKDDSIWYVIEDSDDKLSTVKLIKETQIDINGDGIFDGNDKKAFSSNGNIEYNKEDKASIAYYLENEYKPHLNGSVGTIKEISLMTSKEFVKVREKMEYGYEWSEGNWLANTTLGTWWINTSQNESIYAVSIKGSYKLYKASQSNYIRPVITIEKELTQKKTRQN